MTSAAQILLDHYRETMTLPEALARVQKNIDIGRSGWADPKLLAALEKVHAAAKPPLLPDNDTAVERLAAAMNDAEVDGVFGPGYVPEEAAAYIIERLREARALLRREVG